MCFSFLFSVPSENSLSESLFFLMFFHFLPSHFDCLLKITQITDLYTMPISNGPSHFPVFVAPLHANHQRPPGYVPGRVAPVCLPPPAKAPPPPPVKPHGPPPVHRATFSVSEGNRCKQRKQRRNTFVCVGVSIAAFFITIVIFILRSGDVIDGEYKLFSLCNS